MEYHEFKILFKQLELGTPTLPEIASYYGVSARTLSRWKAKGFSKLRNEKFYYCEICDDWFQIKHIHKTLHQNVSKKDMKANIVKKYNKKVANYFQNY